MPLGTIYIYIYLYIILNLFQNTMVFYHGFPVSKQHGIPWFFYLPSKPKAQMAGGQGSHWLIESPTMFIYV